MTVKIKFKPLHNLFKLPQRATKGSAGFDMVACIDEPVKIFEGQTVAISLGCSVEIPEGYEIQVRPRSGLALKQNITILNSPGTIDSDFRGTCMAIVHRAFSPSLELLTPPFVVNPGDRICQFVVSKIPDVEMVLDEELTDTERGAGGFGSTGVK
jgi:dUTP pyrophosphatase